MRSRFDDLGLPSAVCGSSRLEVQQEPSRGYLCLKDPHLSAHPNMLRVEV